MTVDRESGGAEDDGSDLREVEPGLWTAIAKPLPGVFAMWRVGVGYDADIGGFFVQVWGAGDDGPERVWSRGDWTNCHGDYPTVNDLIEVTYHYPGRDGQRGCVDWKADRGLLADLRRVEAHVSGTILRTDLEWIPPPRDFEDLGPGEIIFKGEPAPDEPDYDEELLEEFGHLPRRKIKYKMLSNHMLAVIERIPPLAAPGEAAYKREQRQARIEVNNLLRQQRRNEARRVHHEPIRIIPRSEREKGG